MKAIGYSAGKPVDIELAMIPTGLYMRKDAAYAYQKMYGDALTKGIHLYPNSAFRTMEKQTLLFANYVKEMARFVKGSRPDRPSIVARPGFSNHQSGIAVDINRAPGDNLKTPEPDSPIDLWLNDNAKTHGYCRTVPSESWHYEYRPELIHGSK